MQVGATSATNQPPLKVRIGMPRKLCPHRDERGGRRSTHQDLRAEKLGKWWTPSLRTISPRPIVASLIWRECEVWLLRIRVIAPRLLQFHSSPADTSLTGIVKGEEAHVRWIALKESANAAQAYAIAVDGGGPSHD